MPSASPSESRSDRDRSLGPLLRRVAAGDREAFAAVYDRLAPVLSTILRARGFDATASERFSEELFTRLWRSAPQAAVGATGDAAWAVGLIDSGLRARRRSGRSSSEVVHP